MLDTHHNSAGNDTGNMQVIYPYTGTHPGVEMFITGSGKLMAGTVRLPYIIINAKSLNSLL